MKLLVTGANGFIAKNLIAELVATTEHEILSYDKETDVSSLDSYCEKADFVFQ